jgi:hypothetical protein
MAVRGGWGGREVVVVVGSNLCVHASIKASITCSGNCQTVIDSMSALKLTAPRSPPLFAKPKTLFG